MVSYTVVISALSRSGRLSEAKLWLERMVESGVRPDIRCFNTLITGLASNLDWDEIDNLLAWMRQLNTPPDQWTYGPLLEACRRSGDKARARRIGKSMLSAPAACSAFCLNSLTRTLGEGPTQALFRECGVEWDKAGFQSEKTDGGAIRSGGSEGVDVIRIVGKRTKDPTKGTWRTSLRTESPDGSRSSIENKRPRGRRPPPRTPP